MIYSNNYETTTTMIVAVVVRACVCVCVRVCGLVEWLNGYMVDGISI